MKILMISWEYPPKNVGGLSNHVYYLSHALSKKGHEIHVITCEEGTSPIEENDNGVFVHRVSPYKIDTDDFAKWVMQLNFAIVEEATRLIINFGKFDLIHAHDWLSAFSAKNLKWSFKIPMVCTIHATEYGRNAGIKTDMQRYICSTEWLLTYEAWKIVVCSDYMRQQVSNIFVSPWDKIWVIPNGVDTEKFNFEFDWINFRRRFANDNEKIVLYVGRHVFEKGIHLLVEAAPKILNDYNDTKIVIGGTGPMTEELKNTVRQMGIESKVVFTGYMSDDDRDKLYRVASVAVFPSLYEPFGIVALEAMAAGCPVVVSETGGLGEIVQHEVNGLKAISASSESLAINITRLLLDDGLSDYIKENGLKTVYEKYTWDKIADLTISMYSQVKEETKDTEWEVRSEDKIKNDIIKKLTEELRDKVREKLKFELKDKVEKKLEEELKEKVEKNLIEKFKNKISDKTKDVVEDAIDMKDKIAAKTIEAVEGLKNSNVKVEKKISKKKKRGCD
jgi:glycosyltransferase involved in cell wall biosynthesis